MEQEIRIWHNNQCSTSRKVLAFLQSTGKEIIIRDYISAPPSIQELKNVLKMMGQKPEFILRKKDKVYEELFADQELSASECLKAMKKHPSIIERPIVITNDKAYLARPFDEFFEKFSEAHPVIHKKST